MSKQSESKIVCAVIRELVARGYWTTKIHGGPYQRAGIPDVLAVKDGRALWVEVKRPGEKPTKIQEHVMAGLRAAGCVVIVASSSGDIDAALARKDSP